MRTFWRIVFFIREYLFPSGCALCGESLEDMEECWYGLCRPCMASCRPGEERRCRRCGRPLISEEGECLPCRAGGDRQCEGITALFPYAGKYRQLLAAYKFGASRSLGHFFADRILEFLSKEGANSPGGTAGMKGAVWVPVPPRPGKIRASGWDQVEYLARLLEKRLPLSRCLRRLPSRNQKELGLKDRRANLRGRIRLTGKPPALAILLDDLVTSGSTLEACAAALRAGGTAAVRGFCLFYD